MSEPIKISYKGNEIYSSAETETLKLKTKKKIMLDDVTVQVDLDNWANVSDADAISSDILSGKSAYSANGKIIGTIETKSSETIIPTTSDQTIAAGKYLTGTQTIKGDANLIPANIAKDVSIFGVTGTHEGGSSSEPMKDVNFYDYDGTIVESYTATEFANLTELPSNPSHDGLTAQGWNWTLANAKTYVATYGKLNIGQMYTTSDGKTRIYIHLEEGRLSPVLGVCPNGTVAVDWGDGSATTTLTGTSVTTVKWTSNHTYAAAGDYVITLTVSGSMGFLGESGGGYILRFSRNTDNRNYGYCNSVKKIEIGSNVTSIGRFAFYNCYSLYSVTIPSSVTSIGSNAFQYCCSLTSITIPSGVTSIESYAFQYCYSLTSITIPNSVTSIGNFAINGCSSIRTVIIPNTVTSFGTYIFSGCYSLYAITIPSGVTSIQNYAFYNCLSLISATISNTVTSIKNNAFGMCYSLASITIPSSVTNIESQAFSACYSLSFIKFEATTPPTVASSNAWSNIPTDCVIYVPSASLNTYKTATNYPSASTYTYVGY